MVFTEDSTELFFLSTYEAFAHVIDPMFNQHVEWLSIPVSCETPARARCPVRAEYGPSVVY